MFNSVDDMKKLGQSQIEAATVSAAAISRGVQQIAAESSAFAKKSVEDGSAAATRLFGTRSFDAALRVQADYAKTALDGMVAQAGKMSALMMAVGRDAAKPFDLTGKP